MLKKQEAKHREIKSLKKRRKDNFEKLRTQSSKITKDSEEDDQGGQTIRNSERE